MVASFMHSSIEVSGLTLYFTSLGKYFAVVFPITIALKLSSQVNFLKKHSTVEGEVKIKIESFSKFFEYFHCK